MNRPVEIRIEKVDGRDDYRVWLGVPGCEYALCVRECSGSEAGELARTLRAVFGSVCLEGFAASRAEARFRDSELLLLAAALAYARMSWAHTNGLAELFDETAAALKGRG